MDLYSARSIKQFYLQTPYLHLPHKHMPNSATTDCSGRHLIAAYYSFIDPRKDERLS